jgi:uroporphyrinogen III methyltransferase/synthase
MSSADNAQPLRGRRVVVTRAGQQASGLVAQLASAGAEVIVLPAVSFLDPIESHELDAAIAELGGFDWLVFTSANAVRFFVKRCRHRGRWPLPAALQCAVVGSATREALEQHAHKAALMPREASAAALAAELRAHWNNAAGAGSGRRVLVPRSDRADDRTIAALQAAGADVLPVVAYRTALPDTFDLRTMELLKRGDADAIVFFSPSAFQNLAVALGADTLRAMRKHVAFAAIGPTTSAAMREAGVIVAIEPTDTNTTSLILALEAYFADRMAVKGRP